MPPIDKLIFAVRKGRDVTSVRFRHLPDEMHTVIKSRDGKVALQLGKTITPAELWMAKQTKRFRKFGTKKKGIAPNSTAHTNSVEVYTAGRGWAPLADLPDPPGASKRRLQVHRQITSGKGPGAIASSSTYQALLDACKEGGIPCAAPIATKVDMAFALIVDAWKEATGCGAV